MTTIRVQPTNTFRRLTGRTRLRTTWRGKIVVQVEESVMGEYGFRTVTWRDAKLIDIDWETAGYNGAPERFQQTSEEVGNG